MNDATVFVVDDHAAVRNSMRRLLSSVGLRGVTYRSAQEFLDDRDPAAPGCIVLDVRMPGMSGLELQRRLRAMEDDIPIIFVTAYADVPLAVRSMRSGAISVLEKPYDPHTLIELIQEGIRLDRDRRRCRAEQQVYDRRFADLTDREQQVLEFVVAGLSSTQIATRLGLSVKTVHAHRSQMMAKMDAGSVAELTRFVVTARQGSNSASTP